MTISIEARESGGWLTVFSGGVGKIILTSPTLEGVDAACLRAHAGNYWRAKGIDRAYGHVAFDAAAALARRTV